jgi:hypothetical protein
MTNEADLQSKWWWRALKAIYVLAWAFALLGLTLLAYFERPQQTPSSLSINIDCTKKENSESVNTFISSSADIQDPTFFGQQTEQQIRKDCEYGGKNIDYSKYPDIPTRNFTVRTYLDKSGSWWYFPIGFLILFTVIETIKTIILYIIGVGVLRGMLLYGLMFINEMLKSNKKGGNNG